MVANNGNSYKGKYLNGVKYGKGDYDLPDGIHYKGDF
jgi:hypothetical protein